MAEKKLKHLEFIQATISRMAGNLFFLRGWTVTLVIGLFALAEKSTNQDYIIMAFIPLFMFWLLDGFFLSQEKLFRDLYDKVRNIDEEDVDFSMDTSEFKVYKKNTWVYALASTTLLCFYLPVLISMLLMIYLTK